MVELVELQSDESWGLAASQPLCRVAWSTGSGPVVIPVNHVIHDHTLWFRTSAYSSLVREVDDEMIAVLVDEVDAESKLGWSVQLRGVAHVHWHREEVPEDVLKLHTWASGPRPLWIELAPTEIHGRRLISGD
ncbi:pyridoxamine 5'-phosphate oxidase family protein [Nocardioides sp. CER19]|uniref:pyridoxamine 5'-phosphate oxidase family protein n=1 Tax=Nocardioides sp. CER19 TaxID=3038538 RepID=UPI00244B4AEF|nr:pyridoxamine 5'-phosphate oxidase family protein [Nocardioides sp. CER19]MDH2415531.1 pyridoxamine 5'-phosphate oxidase family protein [Nocardioides sp. CER19]